MFQELMIKELQESQEYQELLESQLSDTSKSFTELELPVFQESQEFQEFQESQELLESQLLDTSWPNTLTTLMEALPLLPQFQVFQVFQESDTDRFKMILITINRT